MFDLIISWLNQLGGAALCPSDTRGTPSVAEHLSDVKRGAAKARKSADRHFSLQNAASCTNGRNAKAAP